MYDAEEARSNFLLKMYETAWQNITRTDDQLWKVFISYATVVLGAAILSDKVLNQPFLGVLVAMVLSFVTTCFSFNVNLWFLRNIIIVANLEANFLNGADYGIIIPRNWRPPYKGWFLNVSELPSILGLIYPVFAMLIVFNYWNRFTFEERAYLIMSLVLITILTLLYVGSLLARFEKLKRGAPGGSVALSAN